MKTAPSGWANIVNGGNYTYECKLNIAGVDILQSGIYEMTINGSAVSSSASVGGAIAGEINVVVDIVPKDDPDINLDGGTFIWTDGANANGGTFWSGGDSKDGGTFTGVYIPKMASLIPYIRVVSNGNGAKSDWLKMGEYFIDTREKDVKNGKFTAHGYDAMLKAEQTYMPSVTETSMTTKAIVNEIAALIGVGVASETTTILNTTYSVPYYAGQYTAREMLQYIGAAYYGSFIIDDNGNLKLIRLTSTGTNTDIGGRAKSFELSEETLTYNKVVIVTSPTEEITAGSGNNILEFDCPFGTQAMANAILSALSNYEYRGYKAGTALITPLYEIGDSVTIKDTTVQILKRTFRFNALMASDLEAPYSEEIQHEFIYKRQEERKIERLAANTASEFTIQNNKIEARVEKTTYNQDINDPTTGLKAVVTNLETQIDGKVTTWAQDSNPATAWTTTDLKDAHLGDLWYYTGTTTITSQTPNIEPSKTYKYTKSGSTYKWAVDSQSSMYTYLYDFADGKTTIYYGTTSGTYENVEAGDYLVDSSTGSTYKRNAANTAWEKVTDYKTALESLQSTLEEQIDGKIETWAQNTNPATWANADRDKHIGDLWYYTGVSDTTVGSTTIEPSKTYKYTKSGSTYSWTLESSASMYDTLYDYADGKSTIFYGSVSGTYTGVETGDYLVDSTSGSTYRWSGSAWVEQSASTTVNLLPSVYYTEYVNGTEPYLFNGITWTLNKDGSVRANGTAVSAGSWYNFSGTSLTTPVPVITIDPTKRYRLHGCPSPSNNNFRMVVRRSPEGVDPSTSTGAQQSDYGSGVTLAANMKYAYVYAYISGGVEVDITFYPMLEVGTINHAYVSSHENTTALLSSELDSLKGDLEGQIDGKIQTWVRGDNHAPSYDEWGGTDAEKRKHIGDIWYYTGTTNLSLTASGITVEPSKTYQYYLDTSVTPNVYKWREYTNPSKSLYDFADGKRTIFYGATSGIYDAHEDDYLVDSSNGTTYRWDGSAWIKLLNAPAVNLLPPIYRREYQQGSNTYTSNGITWTVNEDGSVTANGTATAVSYFTLTAQTDTDYPPRAKLDPTKRYRLHGCPSGGSSTKYRMRCQRTLANGGATAYQNDNGSGVTLAETANRAYIYLEVANGYNTGTNGITFYPMLEEGTVSHSYVSSHSSQAAYTSAQFTILDNAIQSKVSQTDYNGNEIASLINQTATTVAISADKLTFDGKTVSINSGGFTVSGSGSSWSFINLTYSNYNAKLNPQGITLANTTTKNQVDFYSSGMWFKYNGVNRLTIGAGSDGTPYFNLYDASAVNIMELTSGGNLRFKNNGSNVIWTTRTTGAINAAAFNPTSRIETKSNIKKATGALDKILGTDILSYNLKIENNEDKRHTGVVIGGKYKVPDDIVAVDEDGTASGVDLYSMVSISWKAIQELKAEVDELKGGK